MTNQRPSAPPPPPQPAVQIINTQASKAGNVIDRLPEVFRYPLKADPLSVIGIYAVCSLVLLIPVFWVKLIKVALLAYLYRYCANVLQYAAMGNREPPQHMALASDDSGWAQVWMMFFLFVLMYFLVRMLGGFGVGLAMLVLLAMPAVSMCLAMDNSFFGALNPSKNVQLIGTIGGPYVVLVVFSVVSLMCQGFLAVWLSALPGILMEPLYNAIAAYCTIASFYLMGLILQQSADSLGIDQVEQADTTLAAKRVALDPDQALLDEVAALAESGQIEKAALELGAHIKARGGTSLVHQRYRELLYLWNVPTKLIEHGKSWLTVLLAQEKFTEAVALYQENLKLDPQFRPNLAEEFLPLAQALAKTDPRSALVLLNGFQTRFPKSKWITPTLLFAAKVFAEQMQQTAQSQKILQWLQANVSDATQLAAVRDYAAFVSRLNPTTPLPPPQG
jgi:tetratricopeptide (TPR) repeat protein